MRVDARAKRVAFVAKPLVVVGEISRVPLAVELTVMEIYMEKRCCFALRINVFAFP